MKHEGATVCLHCGFDVRKRRKAKRRYQPMALEWESDMPLSTRLVILGCFWGFHLLVAIGAWFGGHLASAVVAWFPLTLIVCFVVGTYDRVQLLRDERGRVTVVKHWRVFFVPLAPHRHEVRGYEGVVMGGWNDSGIMEWFICLCLLTLGCVPAIVWWYVAIYQNHYHVGMAEDHGRVALPVYRGRSEDQMHEIAKAMCDATGLGLRL
jgi:hypothetical protein